MIPLHNGFYLFPLSCAVNSNRLIFDPSEVEIHQYLLRGETANHVNFMQPMLVSYSRCYFSSLDGGIGEVSKY